MREGESAAREDPGDRLKGVRKLELRYSGSRPGAAKLFVERSSSEVAVCEMDGFLVGALLENVCRTDENMAARLGGRR